MSLTKKFSEKRSVSELTFPDCSFRQTARALRAAPFLLAGFSLLSGSAMAQQEPAKEERAKRKLEEVIVTAQKTEQAVQDVPISMSVMTEEFMVQQGVTSVEEALIYVPNFKVVEFAGRVSPQCRGFVVSDSNPAFEAPCGIALDGLAFSRGSYFSAGLMDLSRMEVLRGPQGTTFGKNTTAGVVSLISKDPTDVFAAKVDLKYAVEGPGKERAEVAFGGPLIPEMVNFRVVHLYERQDPFMENTYHQTDPNVSEDVGNSERDGYRVKLTFPDLLGAELKLLHERTTFFLNGYGIQVKPETDAAEGIILQYDPNAEFGQNYKVSNLGNEVWIDTVRNQFELNYDFDGWIFTGVGGVGGLENRQSWGNILPTPYPFAASRRSEDSPFKSAEFRAASPDFSGLLGLDNLFGLDLGTSRVRMGVFAQKNEIRELNIDADFSYEGLALIVAGLAPVYPAGLPTLIPLNQRPGGPPSESFFIRFSQETVSEALFSQLTWDLNERWAVDIAGRYSEERKNSFHDVSYSQPAPAFDPAGDRAYTKEKERISYSFQPKVSATYRLSEEINIFAHWAQAFKSGGFNAYTSTGDPEKPRTTNPNQNATVGSLEYDDETGTDWGLDFKMRLLDNTLQLNLSFFRLTAEDFQVLVEVLGTEVPGSTDFLGGRISLPDGYQQVVNAGEARAQGVELDAMWLANDWLTVIGAIGYNDTEYLSFPLDACGPHEDPDPNTGRCDHTGMPFLNTPKLSGALTLHTNFRLGDWWNWFGNTEMQFGLTGQYTGERFEGSYAPWAEEESEWNYSGHFGFSNPAQGWSIKLAVENPYDDYLGTEGRDPSAPLQLVVPRRPRTYTAQFNWSY